MIDFKECKIEDIEELQKLSQITYLNSFISILNEDDVKIYTSIKYSLENLKIELENKTTQFLFLTLDNEKIGYIKYDYNSAKLKNSLDIDRIYLLDTHKNKGLGSKLLQKAESIAKEKNKIQISIKKTIQRGRYLKLEILRKLSPLVILFLEFFGIVFRSLFN